MPVKRNNEAGFTMVTMMCAMFLVVTLAFSTLAVADNDQGPSRKDNQRRDAYAAAEAGIQNYLFHLVQDNDYWDKCTAVNAPNAVNQAWNGTGADTRTRWLPVPGSSSRYALELLPANGNASCVKNNSATMIDKSTGSFRIRATGQVLPSGTKRSIVATFKRTSFLNFVYFTDLETQNPAFYIRDVSGLVSKENPRPGGLPQRDIVQWARETCGTTYWYKGRSALRFTGNKANDAGLQYAGDWYDHSQGCTEISFRGPATDRGSILDVVNGPIHTNDEFSICGFPAMGRKPQDAVEVSGPGRALTGSETNATVGWRRTATSSVCPSTGTPDVNFTTTGPTVEADRGVWRPNADVLSLPPTNTSLRKDADPAYRFTGRTQIRFRGDGKMDIIGTTESGTSYGNDTASPKVWGQLNEPIDGVLYVSNGSCGTTYDPLKPYVVSSSTGAYRQPSPTGCGNIEVSGSYVNNITLGADNDIIVMNDLKRANSTALLGLISNNFIRVFHPVTLASGDTPGRDCSNDNATAPKQADGVFTIDAAMLSLSNSITVDSFWCGGAQGILEVNGVLAQKFRGAVGLVGGEGYIKKYEYNDELRFRSPPKFLDPVQAGWGVQLYTEQVPAR